MAKRLIPTLNRVLVEKIVPPAKTTAGILLPETSTKLNSGKVVSVGPGLKTNEGKTIPTSVKEGDTVLLPEYGGTQVKLNDKEYVMFLCFYCTCELCLLSYGSMVPGGLEFESHLKPIGKRRKNCLLVEFYWVGLIFYFFHFVLVGGFVLCRFFLYRDEDILGTLHE
uniref:Protein groES n=1 Tax=Rhizophora mucronata TaxID=61149 RepID=A0A2P2IQN6_RHIMU